MRNANENAAKKTRRNLAIGASAVAAAFMFALSASPVAAVAAEAPAGADIPDVVSVWRLYNEATGEHLYTTDDHEVQVLTSSYGWKSEGEGWKASTEGEPVWRLYQPTLNDHLYTDDEHEVQVLTTERGWRADFDGEPLFFSSGTVDVYRLYNSASGRHLITRDVNEYVTLPGKGWTQEGVKLHGVGLDDTWVDEVGHWEQQQTGQNWVPWQYREYTLYTCAGCGYSTESHDEIVAHQNWVMDDHFNGGLEHPNGANYYAVPKSEKIGGGYYEPVYENVWVVDSPGHWE